MRIIKQSLVHYDRSEKIQENSKTVVKTTRLAYTLADVRPATEGEVRKWRDQ